MDHGEGRGPGLETIRALHQTVVALRAALEESKSEILELKSKAWPVDTVQEALRTLSLENHVLRRKLINWNGGKSDKAIETENEKTDSTNIEPIKGNTEEIRPRYSAEDLQQLENTENISPVFDQLQKKKVTIISPKQSPKKGKRKIEAKISIKTESISTKKISRSLESLTILKSPLESSRKLSFSKTFSFSNLSSHINREFNFDINQDTSMSDKKEDAKKQTENDINENTSIPEEPQSPQNDLEQAEEVDDIELIFTTDDTKDSDFKEQLVSIDAGDSVQEASNILQLPLSDVDHLDASDRELDDDVFNDNFENENQENTNFQSLEMKRGNSQIYDSKSDNSINQEKSLKSYYSLQDSSFENKSLEKDESFDRFDDRIRIVETDISKCGIHDVEYVAGRRNTCPNPLQYRPLLHREALSKGLTVGRKSRPILTHSNAIRKESGAQTDISALPGSSWRSESSLANKARLGENFTTLPSKFPMPGSRLRLSEKTVEARRVLLSDIGFTSMVPELSRSADHLFPPNLKPVGPAPTYGQFLRTTDLYSPGCTSQKFTWAAAASPSDGSQTQSRYSSMYPLPSPPAPSRRCSAPVSPSRRNIIKQTPSKVKFANGSLPELRSDWTVTVDSGDSTDSLVEEAENYLRRSIDCIMTGRDIVASSYSEATKSVPRRASAPEPSRDNVPPPGWQPFLPRISRDLKPDHWVKVITQEGRVRGGRVRYVGPVVSQTEQFVGVQLSNPDGYCDGTYGNRRYFQCEPYHGIFVSFKKVIMGWRP
ncbi:uncharacterized protein LOC108909562 [Anoplophora glabripennis]|uniref:uncharacterized protein LOC108909562 n=1 Tax=Anoplophora glabripennis TaxID=217634 RepID=UPI000875985E|nr:uncharacterized protein LOC108909562 [Anoplophora glabripennis]XP_018569457.1 uncharacterized protein LOC108909562 [Anoplophora glabripennis]XP_018569458.1 uncharacterized protein LOC108909562 [Anoplophora glabripennis]